MPGEPDQVSPSEAFADLVDAVLQLTDSNIDWIGITGTVYAAILNILDVKDVLFQGRAINGNRVEHNDSVCRYVTDGRENRFLNAFELQTNNVAGFFALEQLGKDLFVIVRHLVHHD